MIKVKSVAGLNEKYAVMKSEDEGGAWIDSISYDKLLELQKNVNNLVSDKFNEDLLTRDRG